MQVTHPATHGDKLVALRANGGLPQADRARLEEAVQRYRAWVTTLKTVQGESDVLLACLVDALNDYKRYIELELIFDAEDSFL